MATIRERFNSSYTIKGNGCWEWTKALVAEGYGTLWVNGKQRRANRIAWELFRGDIPDRMFVCHTCDVPRCVNPDHLFLGTPKDNSQDAVKKGHFSKPRPNWKQRGERHPMAFLTEGDIRKIRNEFAAGGVTKAEIARKYSMSHGHVSAIVKRVIWKHVD